MAPSIAALYSRPGLRRGPGLSPVNNTEDWGQLNSNRHQLKCKAGKAHLLVGRQWLLPQWQLCSFNTELLTHHHESTAGKAHLLVARTWLPP